MNALLAHIRQEVDHLFPTKAPLAKWGDTDHLCRWARNQVAKIVHCGVSTITRWTLARYQPMVATRSDSPI
jgi:hypothetical protein